GGGLVRIWAVCADLRRVYGQGRPRRTDELRFLQRHEDRRNAEGRIDHHALRWFLGRRGRADDLRCGAGSPQRHLRRDRPAYPVVPTEESEHTDNLTQVSLRRSLRVWLMWAS